MPLLDSVLPTALTGSNQAIKTQTGTYYGFSVHETTGTGTALIRIYDNASAASGTILDVIALAAGESAREFYPTGLRYLSGVYVNVVSGSIEGSVRAV